MKPIKNINAVIIAPFFTVILLALPVAAHADWSATGMHLILAPNFSPSQGQPIQHEVHVSPVRVEPQHPVELPRPAQHYDRPVTYHQTVEHHLPGHFRRDADYHGDVEVIFPYPNVNSAFVVPDGFELVMVNGETFYYNQGVFYSQVGNQLASISPVLGAVVDYIPQDYRVMMADGVNYLFTRGVYYVRVDQRFEVVQPPFVGQS